MLLHPAQHTAKKPAAIVFQLGTPEIRIAPKTTIVSDKMTLLADANQRFVHANPT
jgi:hypothetical protein